MKDFFISIACGVVMVSLIIFLVLLPKFFGVNGLVALFFIAVFFIVWVLGTGIWEGLLKEKLTGRK